MVTQDLEQSRSEVIETPKTFPVRVAAGSTDFSGRHIVFECDQLPHGADENGLADSFLQLDEGLRERFDRQIEQFRRDLSMCPDSPALLNNAGLALLNNGKFEEATSHLEAAIAADPKYWPARANLVRALLATGLVDRALFEGHRLIAEKSTTSAWLALAGVYAATQRHQDAVSAYTEALKMRTDDVAALYSRGVQYLLLNDRNGAIADIRRAVSIKPKMAAAHNALGVCYVLQGSLRKAVRSFEVAAHLQPAPSATRNLCNALILLGDTDRGLAVLERHLERFPQDAEIRERLANTFRELGKRRDCLRELSAVVSSAESSESPTIPRLYNNLGVALSEVGELEDAEYYLRRSIDLWPGERVPFQNLARILLNNKHIRQAQALYAEHLAQFEDAFTFTFGGRLSEIRGDYSEAKRLYYRAIEVEPNCVFGYSGLSKLLCEIDSAYEQAIQVLQTGLENCPNDQVLKNNLAYAYLMLDRIGPAKEVLATIRPTEDGYFLTATRGLLLIHQGDIAGGSQLYNRAATMVADRSSRKLVEQKKNIELARHWFKSGQLERARHLITVALQIDPSEDLFKEQATRLARQIDSAFQQSS